MSATANKQQFTFQTEIKQLLQILSHSLYQNREIAIRELISNASDSLNKFRYLQLTDSQFRDESALQITLEPDKEGKILTIRDNGVGLTHAELVENLGTIAHSGSLEFFSKLAADKKSDVSLIGQFGVGFYSAFMLADKVEVVTRSSQEETGWRWESDGTGSYTIEPADDVARGAAIRLHLKEDLVEEFTRPDRLKHIIRRYSTFVPFPIKLADEQLNEQRPIWVEPKSQLTEEQYHGFYDWLTHRVGEKPLWHLHLSSDSPLQFQAILYCPPQNMEALGFGRLEHGLSLCAKRILVQDDNKDLLPEYLHFLYGLVDSADLPLNVSRETLQDNLLIPKLRRVLTKKVLDHLSEVAESNPADYRTFYEQFGSMLRTGIGADYDNRERIAKLLRFASSHNSLPDATTSLDEYLKRAPEDQKQIYFLGGPDLATLQRNPHLEAFSKRNLEVLFLTDPVDEFSLQHLQDYQGKRLISIDSSDVEFPESAKDLAESKPEEAGESPASSQIAPAGFERVLELFRAALGDRVKEVRKSSRLVESPVCLVNPQGSMSSQLQKVLSQNIKDFTLSKKILEVNSAAPLIQRLCVLSGNSEHEAFIRDCGQQLYVNAMLLEGMVVEPDDAATRMQRFMESLAQGKSTIIT